MKYPDPSDLQVSTHARNQWSVRNAGIKGLVEITKKMREQINSSEIIENLENISENSIAYVNEECDMLFVVRKGTNLIVTTLLYSELGDENSISSIARVPKTGSTRVPNKMLEQKIHHKEMKRLANG